MGFVTAVIELGDHNILVEIQSEDGAGLVAEPLKASDEFPEAFKTVTAFFPKDRRIAKEGRHLFRLDSPNLLAAIAYVWKLLAAYRRKLRLWVRTDNNSIDPVFKLRVDYPDLSVVTIEPDELDDFSAFIAKKNVSACISRLQELEEVVSAGAASRPLPVLQLRLKEAAVQPETVETTLCKIATILAGFEDESRL